MENKYKINITMDCKDKSVSLAKTDVTPESQVVNNIENEDNKDSCVKEVSGEKEGSCITSDISHLDKDADEPEPAGTGDEVNKEAENETNEEINHEKSEEIDKETNKISEEANEVNEEKNENINKETNEEIDKETNEEIDKETNEEIDKETNEEIDKEVNGETNKEVTAIAESEKDLTPLNIETSDSAIPLETLENNTDDKSKHTESEKTEVTTPFIEKNSEIVINEENNSIENSCTASILIDTPLETLEDNTDNNKLKHTDGDKTEVTKPSTEKNSETVTSEEFKERKEEDKETSEVSTHNLSEKCDVEQSSTCEDLPKDNTESEIIKPNNENVAIELETSAERNEPCENSDELNTNTNDEQVAEKEVESSKKTESESSDSNLENLEKDLSEKNIEPENTEFVQFSHDKHDDTQIENQSMDAEDPFGGDNLPSENVEEMETDTFVEDEISFKGLYDQGDNLQEAISTTNANSNNCNEKLSANSELNDTDPKIVENVSKTSDNVQTIDSLETATPMDTDPPVSASETGTENTSSAKSLNAEDKQAKKNIEEVTPMETDEEQTNVLPGQDDELCIIPDSMKVIIPDKSGKTVDNEQSKSTLDKDSKQDEATSKSNSELNKDTSRDDPSLASTENKNNAENTVTIQNEHTPTTKDVTPSTDVINIEDESKNPEVEEIINKETCKQCGEERACKIQVKIGVQTYNVCSKTCKALFIAANNKAVDIPNDGTNSKQDKCCANCLLIIDANEERNLSWETMEFCNEECLGKFQRKYGSYCKNCNGLVQSVSLGKYCVRFGCDVRQFCCSTCLEEFKKGLKVCSYCQKDISSSTDGFLAPVGEKGQFKDFCTQDCMEKYSKLNSSEPMCAEKKSCSVCKEEKVVHCEIQLRDSTPVAICSEPCFAAFKFVKQVQPEQCSTCKKFFELLDKQHFIVFYKNEPYIFCNKTCLNIFIITNRKIVPCNWCKVKKYNFDMIKKELKSGQILMMCSLNCLTLYQVSINAVSAKRINCDFCKEYSLAHYHLTMSDATIRNFCSYNCVMNFQTQYTKSPITIPSSDDPVPTGAPKKTTLVQKNVTQTKSQVQVSSEMQNKKTMPVISSVTSLAAIGSGQASPNSQQNNIVMPTSAMANKPTQVIYKQQVITRPPSPVKIHNRSTQCKPLVHTKGVSVRPHPCMKSTQTTENLQHVVVPIPVPIYVPVPMYMYNMPFPVPMPFPLPIPVPLFIPTTRNSAKGIMKDIKKIQEKIPADPYEAELLMMAEMVATEKKTHESDSDSVDDREDDTAAQENLRGDGFSPEDPVDSSNTFGDDMLQMALKMATGELDEPAVDLEAALTPNTITATQSTAQSESAMDNDVQSERLMVASRGRKRVMPYKPRSTPNKRPRRVSGTNEMPLMPPPEPQPPPQPRIMEPIEKPDANMALKYTFGVNAWRQWVIGKNAELEKQITPMRKIKLFKTDLLQLTADELNYSLCLFVKEVRKPNGAEYAPDTIYYLCLGIQQYLFENNRIDNIFTDSYYEKFTDCLNEVAKKFSVLYNDAQYIVTRVEEEHLWECKQLGAHSPHVLLSTLMFFNTKHFNLVTVEEHMQLSFSHIMKHWKRNPAAQPTAMTGKVPGSRNVLLRFYPPQSALEANSRKKKVYEQQENEENPLRCPVKLYEFYLSKCPESVKTRNDVFYLLPERSCVPDSPVWYSTSPLAKEHLIKMLYRIKMVKEINVALLTS